MITVLVASCLIGFAGLPPSTGALALGGPTLRVFVPWARWVDRHRTLVARDGPGAAAGPR